MHQSASDIVREEIRSRGLEPTRELQTSVANEVRKEKGEAYFVFSAIKRATESEQYDGRVVISGLYAPAEGEYFKLFDSTLISVSGLDSDSLSARYERVVARNSGSRDKLSYEEFVAAYQRENGGIDSNEANVGKLALMCDVRIVHGGTREELLPLVGAVVKEYANG